MKNKKLRKAELIATCKKIIEDKKLIHDYIVNGKDLNEIKHLFSQPI